MSLKQARICERRRHDGLAEATLRSLASTKAERKYYEVALETAWEYGEHTPFEAACDAWRTGDREGMLRALADENRLHALAEAT